MNERFRRLAFALAMLIMGSQAQAANVRAWLDRSSMQLGETVTLNVEVGGDTSAAQPDLTALAQDFELLGTQSSSSVNIVNGQSSSKLLWAVGLQPKHEGTFTIPALTVAGQQTLPLTLHVQPAAVGGRAGDDVYVEASVEPRAPYVQQQVRLSVKLYYALNLIDGNLADPQGGGLIVRKLGQDSNYNATVGGRAYRVVERHDAVFAETSGALTLPSIVFLGHVSDGNAMDLFFNRGREVIARSQPIALDVRARPAASGTDAWLPARSLTLSASGIEATTSARAGEPLTLTLHMQAQGLGFEQLPELKLPALDGVDVYPDKPTTQNRDDGDWLYADRERKFAIVPNRAGTLTLPPISIVWWDTAHDRAETAAIPAITLEVAPQVGAAAKQSASAENATKLTLPVTASAPPITAAAPVDAGAGSFWRWVAVSLLALWVLTVAVFWLAWRSRRAILPAPGAVEEEAGVGATRRAFADACARGDLMAADRTLLAMARKQLPGLRNLGDLAAILADRAQISALAELQRARYGSASEAGVAEGLARAFGRGPSIVTAKSQMEDRVALPPLYPFRT